MEPLRLHDAQDAHLTLRVRRAWVALLLACALHGATYAGLLRLPQPKKKEERVEFSLASSSKASLAPAPPTAAQKAPALANTASQKKPSRTVPSTSPVQPELLPSAEPPPQRAQLPQSDPDEAPAKPPQPSSWAAQLRESLQETGQPQLLPQALLPSLATLDRVAAADPRLHDEETEQRIQQDYGGFFRRGLEALRSNWHPDVVLQRTERDPQTRCGQTTRTTYAVAVIDKEGNVVDVDLKTPSGCPALDREAILAFKRVTQFPHPPPGIFFGPDGTPLPTARYPVRFIVSFDGGLRLDWR